MGKNSSIGWTDDTDNVIIVRGGGWWCRMCSEGCGNCYAAGLNQNAFYGGNGMLYTGEPPSLLLREDILSGWARQTRPRLHFVASMTDVFGEWVSREWQFTMFDAMCAAPRQIFQVLTKRPHVFAEAAAAWCTARGVDALPWNIWAGVSVENQRWADERREAFRAIPARIKFVSYEPALGPIDWRGWEFVAQIISGGESGPKARPSHPDWHRATRDWCAGHAKAYFFKQWGEFWPLRVADHPITVTQVTINGQRYTRFHDWRDGYASVRVGKQFAGCCLDGRKHEQFPASIHPALSTRAKNAA